MNKRVVRTAWWGFLLIVLQIGMASLAQGDDASHKFGAGAVKRFDVSSEKSWKLVWSDEFNGTTIDPGKWQILSEGPFNLGEGWPKGYRKKENIYLDGKGHLVIRFSRDQQGNLIVAGMKSRDSFLYGYFEARLKLSTQPGWWAAFWLYRKNPGANPFLNGLEIDIFEDFFKERDIVQEALHVGIPSAYAKSFTRRTPVSNWKKFHVFGLEWTPLEYVFYIDGREVLRWGKEQAVTTQPCQVWFSSNTGSVKRVSWTGDYRDAKLPDYYVIDYVRVYKKDNGGKKKPRVVITSPAGSGTQSLKRGARVTITASAEDTDGKIREVYLFDNGYLLETKTAPPYRFKVTFDKAYYAKTDYMRPANLRGVTSLLTEHVFVVMAKDDDGLVGFSRPREFYLESPKPSRPYRGRAQSIPGRIEVEYFDEGAQGIAYNDTDKKNIGAVAAKTNFRVNEGVDTNGKTIGWIYGGEWLKYTVDIKRSGRYTVTVPFAAGPGSPEGEEKGIRLEVDGRFVAEVMMKGVTGGWSKWITVSKRGVVLTKGRHVLTVRMVNGLFNLDYIDFKLEK